MSSAKWIAALSGVFLSATVVKAQCNDPAFGQAIHISEDGRLEVQRPLKGYSYKKLDSTHHRFVPSLGSRVETIIGRPVLRSVVTDEQGRVQSLEFLQWGRMSMPTPEYRLTMAYRDGQCYVETWTHKDGVLLADARMCHELADAEQACASDCEGKAQDEKLKAIIKKYGGSLDHAEKIHKDLKMDINLKSVHSGVFQSVVYLERCHELEPMRQAVANTALWKEAAPSQPSLRPAKAAGGTR